MESVNSILSNEDDCKTYSSFGPEAKLKNFLENVPPPPQNEDCTDEVIEDNCKKLTNALEQQLSELEKHVSESKRKQSKTSQLKVMLRSPAEKMGKFLKSPFKKQQKEAAATEVKSESTNPFEGEEQEEIAALIQECEAQWIIWPLPLA